ncbi:PqqD family protein [Bacteriovorax sp. DB6_IX]|uniref:PqqD family protein n=1 Tax=Bacteriovorax sp. DB6_IX TaxID=1353530 RepID=UPI00038A220B|nr:PqqD family protein [Bacteriovorax sp. DB6_IX]EQC50754.1 PqqD family protein [Bacteriovorax sp. DB6_IX]
MQTIEKAKDISWTKLNDNIVILDTRDGHIYHELNSVASLIWTEITTGSTLDSLIQKVTEEYDIDANTAQHDVLELLEKFKNKGLLS